MGFTSNPVNGAARKLVRGDGSSGIQQSRDDMFPVHPLTLILVAQEDAAAGRMENAQSVLDQAFHDLDEAALNPRVLADFADQARAAGLHEEAQLYIEAAFRASGRCRLEALKEIPCFHGKEVRKSKQVSN